MTQKRNWYDAFSRIIGWEAHRKSRWDCSTIGFLIGIFVMTNVLYLVVVLTSANNLLSIGVSLVILAAICMATLSLLIMWFGYKDLKSVIRNSFFKYSFIAGTSIMLIAIVIINIKISP